MKTLLLAQNHNQLDYVYGPKQIAWIKECSDLLCEKATMEQLESYPETEVIFSTWSMPSLTPDHLKLLPNLKAVFYAAGTVKGFARPLLENNIRLFSAWKSNAIPVAEFTYAQMILAAKGYFRNVNDYSGAPTGKGKSHAFRGPGFYDIRIGILGGGAIGQLVMEKLKSQKIDVVYVDSWESRREVSLEEAFESCFIVSNHFPNLEDNKKVITGDMIMSMPKGGVFINTGRGAQIDEAGLLKAMIARPDLTALLDVTDPEPVQSPDLIQLPNVHISTHIAGSLNNEVHKMSDSMIQEFIDWTEGRPTDNYVDWDRFNMMA
jgi:phosphoglycerate dehydrogenase-like enzyme